MALDGLRGELVPTVANKLAIQRPDEKTRLLPDSHRALLNGMVVKEYDRAS